MIVKGEEYQDFYKVSPRVRHIDLKGIDPVPSKSKSCPTALGTNPAYNILKLQSGIM